METEKRYKITELWFDEHKTLAQSIMFLSDDDWPPEINPNLTHLYLRAYWDYDTFELVKEEFFDHDTGEIIKTVIHKEGEEC